MINFYFLYTKVESKPLLDFNRLFYIFSDLISKVLYCRNIYLNSYLMEISLGYNDKIKIKRSAYTLLHTSSFLTKSISPVRRLMKSNKVLILGFFLLKPKEKLKTSSLDFAFSTFNSYTVFLWPRKIFLYVTHVASKLFYIHTRVYNMHIHIFIFFL